MPLSSYVLSFVHPFIYSFHSYILSFIHYFVHASFCSYIRPFVHLFDHMSFHYSIFSFTSSSFANSFGRVHFRFYICLFIYPSIRHLFDDVSSHSPAICLYIHSFVTLLPFVYPSFHLQLHSYVHFFGRTVMHLTFIHTFTYSVISTLVCTSIYLNIRSFTHLSLVRTAVDLYFNLFMSSFIR